MGFLHVVDAIPFFATEKKNKNGVSSVGSHWELYIAIPLREKK